MMLKRIVPSCTLMGSLAVFLFAAPASAVTVWTNWTSAADGAPGSASGLLNGVSVTYTGEVDAFIINGTSLTGLPIAHLLAARSRLPQAQ